MKTIRNKVREILEDRGVFVYDYDKEFDIHVAGFNTINNRKHKNAEELVEYWLDFLCKG